MSKKVFAIILIVCLAFSVAFAAKKSGFTAGAELGYGAMNFTFSDKDSSDYIRLSNGGFYLAGTVEYGLSKNLSVVGKAGINTLGLATIKISADGWEHTEKDDGSAPVQFVAYVGAQYNFILADNLSLNLGAGFDTMLGKLDSDDKDSFNAAMGIGFEAGVCFKPTENLAITLTDRFAWHFVNTNKDFEDIETLLGDEVSFSNISNQSSIGVKYFF